MRVRSTLLPSEIIATHYTLTMLAYRRCTATPVPSSCTSHHLNMVRCKGQYLWDSEDIKYLDLASSSAVGETHNIVCVCVCVCYCALSTVGHCEESVVEAATSQMAVLNTNSRFLNDHIVTYAQHLCSKFPQSLSCCFFTNSG